MASDPNGGLGQVLDVDAGEAFTAAKLVSHAQLWFLGYAPNIAK